MEKSRQPSHFTIESWNHNAFADKNYHMIWGPFPIQSVEKDREGKVVKIVDNFKNEVITSNLRKFDPKVRLVKYRHADNEHPREVAA